MDDQGTPLTWNEAGTRLRGEYTISRYYKAGYWVPSQVVLVDAAGNERYQRTSDFGWRMHVDNPLEDYTPPEYLPGTLSADVSRWEEDDTVQVIGVDWLVSEDVGMKPESGCYAAINDARPDTYSLEEFGQAATGGDACNVDFLMPDYMPTSTYSVNRIFMEDVARNRTSVEFTGDDGDEPPVSVDIETTNPDTEPPEIDVNRIRISAVPTNPGAPNGETEVTVAFRHRDNIFRARGVRTPAARPARRDAPPPHHPRRSRQSLSNRGSDPVAGVGTSRDPAARLDSGYLGSCGDHGARSRRKLPAVQLCRDSPLRCRRGLAPSSTKDVDRSVPSSTKSTSRAT